MHSRETNSLLWSVTSKKSCFNNWSHGICQVCEFVWTEPSKLDRTQLKVLQTVAAACSDSFMCSAGSTCDSLLLSPARLIIPLHVEALRGATVDWNRLAHKVAGRRVHPSLPACYIPSILISVGSEQQGHFHFSSAAGAHFLLIVLRAINGSRGETSPRVCIRGRRVMRWSKLISPSAVNSGKVPCEVNISIDVLLFIVCLFFLFFWTGDRWCSIVRRSSTPSALLYDIYVNVRVSRLTTCFSTLLSD